MYSNGGKVPRIVDTHVVAHFDPATGRIAHVHSLTIFEGAQALSDQQAVEAARKSAKKCGISLSGLESKDSNESIHGRIPHRIDLASGAFVALDLPQRVRSKHSKPK